MNTNSPNRYDYRNGKYSVGPKSKLGYKENQITGEPSFGLPSYSMPEYNLSMIKLDEASIEEAKELIDEVMMNR